MDTLDIRNPDKLQGSLDDDSRTERRELFDASLCEALADFDGEGRREAGVNCALLGHSDDLKENITLVLREFG